MNFLEIGKMKNLILFFCVALFLCSCVVDEELSGITYAVANESGLDVEIIFRGQVSGEFVESVEIVNGNFLDLGTTQTRNESLITDPNSDLPNQVYPTTLAKLIFNNEREIEYSRITVDGVNVFSEPSSRNIYKQGNYNEVQDNNFVFTITQEDYNNATPCDGPCE